MNVTCLECQSVFRVDPVKVPAGGVRARCSICGGIMPVEAPAATGEEWGATPVAALATVGAGGGSTTPVAAMPIAAPPPAAAASEPSPWSAPPLRGPTPWEGLPTVQTSSGAPGRPATPFPGPAPAGAAGAAPSAPAPASPTPTAPVQPRRPTPFPEPVFASSDTPGDGGTVPPGEDGPRLGPSPFDAAGRPTPGTGAPVAGTAWWAAQGIGGAPGQAPAPAAEARSATPVAPPAAGPAPSPTTSRPSPLPPFGASPPIRDARLAETPAQGPWVPPAAPPARGPTPAFGGAPFAPAAPQPTSAASQPAPSVSQPAPAAAPVPAAPTPPGTPAGPRAPINPFLANDPNAKAKRLARALVSDMITYHPQLREQAAREGTLKQAFKEEIKKSYEEYVEQVGREFAETTAHFQDALNDILAGGRKLF